MSTTKRLVLFDLDGVLLNSRPNMEFAWGRVRERLGVTVSFEDYFALIGRPFGDIMTLLGLTERTPEIEKLFRVSSMDGIDLVNFYPGAEETLLCLQERGFKFGVVTSKDRLRTSAILAKLPVEFTTVQTPEHRFRGKPSPDHLLLAMAEAQTDPADTIYVGDMDADYEAAIRANVDYLHADWGYGSNPGGRAKTIADITQILEIVGAR